ncbi:hypothetical protein V5F60_19245, partial [Xanthobacter flavus]
GHVLVQFLALVGTPAGDDGEPSDPIGLCSMPIIARSTLARFWERHPEMRSPLEHWEHAAKRPDGSVRRMFGHGCFDDSFTSAIFGGARPADRRFAAQG